MYIPLKIVMGNRWPGHQIHALITALVLCPTTARHKKLKDYTTTVHIQYVHTHMDPKVENTRKTMLQVTNVHTTINTQVYFMPWGRCRPLSCLPQTDLTTVTAWLSLVEFCLFFFSGSSKRREVMFLTAEHANRTSSSSDSLGGREDGKGEGGQGASMGRENRESGEGGRMEGEHFSASIFRSKYYASCVLWCHFTMEWHRRTYF